MCRSIKVLRKPGSVSENEYATPDEISAAALQYIRKVSGFRAPSKSNQDAFDAAVREVSDATAKLLDRLRAPKRIAS